MFGTARPMNDIVVQVGGANAGSRLSTKTMMNNKTIMYVRSVDSLTAPVLSWISGSRRNVASSVW
jgi:hypothetical protein